jgi:hypothetical protein
MRTMVEVRIFFTATGSARTLTSELSCLSTYRLKIDSWIPLELDVSPLSIHPAANSGSRPPTFEICEVETP